MALMHKAFTAALLLVAVVAAVPVAKHATPAAKHSPAPKLATPPPEIGHVVSRPFCSALRNNVGPAIGAILANDAVIKAGPGLFSDYNKAVGNGDMSETSRQMAMLKMENMVGPIVANIETVEKKLQDASVFHNPPRTADEAKMYAIQQHLLDVLAMQKASLDIVNGFVQTQQLGDMQHQGFGEIEAATAPDTANNGTQPTPNPMMVDPNAAGLPQDPHFIDPTTIPGLSVGFNPITRLNEGLKWTQSEAHAREDLASKGVFDAVHLCNPTPAATPTP
jgi:hypothetical protein